MPTTPAPSPAETSEQAYASQAKWNPELYKGYTQAYAENLPKLSEADYQNQLQYAPLYKAMMEQLNPGMTSVLPAVTQQALSLMGSAGTPSEAQQTQRASRYNTLASTLGNQANAKYGGFVSGAGRTSKAIGNTLSDYLTGLDVEDYMRKNQDLATALQYATPIMQAQYGSIQQPSVPNYYQSVTPSSDTLYNAAMQSSQPSYYIQPGQQATQSPLWSLAGSALGGAMGGWSTNWK